uniref:Uncharacterized protein n=1 Tax=Rhipicephalus microplus TaxID=6941 RepID=A0A6G5AIN1_RHIMP
MYLYIVSRASVDVSPNANVKATAGQWFVCTSPTISFVLMFFLVYLCSCSIRVSTVFLPHSLRRCVRMPSQVVCYSARDIGRAFQYWWCFLKLMSVPLLSCCS